MRGTTAFGDQCTPLKLPSMPISTVTATHTSRLQRCMKRPALWPCATYLQDDCGRRLSASSTQTYTGNLSQSLHATQPTITSLSYVRPSVRGPRVHTHRAVGAPALACYPSPSVTCTTQTVTDTWSQKTHTPVPNNCTVGRLFLLHSPVGKRHPNPNKTGITQGSSAPIIPTLRD